VFFLTVSWFPGVLSKRVALELIENENGRTASGSLARDLLSKSSQRRNLTEIVTPNVEIMRRRRENVRGLKSKVEKIQAIA
jgi:hypothetical protein